MFKLPLFLNISFLLKLLTPFPLTVFAQNDSCTTLDSKELAIAIVGYNRPDYLYEILEALAQNPESQTTPIYFFFDGGREAKQKENLRVAQEFDFPHAVYVLRNNNFGCAKNLIDARRHLFDKLNYDKAFILEDDNKISSSYISFMLRLYEWSKNNIENVGLISGWSNIRLSKLEKSYYLNKVIKNADANYWAYLMDQNCWHQLKAVYYEYEKLFLRSGGKSQHIKAQAIRKWIVERVKRSKYCGNSYSQKWFLSPHYPTGQDGILRLALWENQMNYTTTMVNRIVNIGKVGLNYSENVWEKHLGMYVLDEFVEDEFLDHFETWTGKIVHFTPVHSSQDSEESSSINLPRR